MNKGIKSAGIEVSFQNVGRGKNWWDAVIPGNNITAEIISEIKKKGALVSREIAIEFDATGMNGVILVGGFREVGTFSYKALQASE